MKKLLALRIKWGYFILIPGLPIGILMCIRPYLKERDFLNKKEKLKGS